MESLKQQTALPRSPGARSSILIEKAPCTPNRYVGDERSGLARLREAAR
jgi:hypothetical protein